VNPQRIRDRLVWAAIPLVMVAVYALLSPPGSPDAPRPAVAPWLQMVHSFTTGERPEVTRLRAQLAAADVSPQLLDPARSPSSPAVSPPLDAARSPSSPAVSPSPLDPAAVVTLPRPSAQRTS
jgi:hypothetical protein